MAPAKPYRFPMVPQQKGCQGEWIVELSDSCSVKLLAPTDLHFVCLVSALHLRIPFLCLVVSNIFLNTIFGMVILIFFRWKPWISLLKRNLPLYFRNGFRVSIFVGLKKHLPISTCGSSRRRKEQLNARRDRLRGWTGHFYSLLLTLWIPLVSSNMAGKSLL